MEFSIERGEVGEKLSEIRVSRLDLMVICNQLEGRSQKVKMPSTALTHCCSTLQNRRQPALTASNECQLAHKFISGGGILSKRRNANLSGSWWSIVLLKG